MSMSRLINGGELRHYMIGGVLTLLAAVVDVGLGLGGQGLERVAGVAGDLLVAGEGDVNL